MDIYFFRQDAVGAMIQNVLNNMGWRDIQVSKSIQGQTAITEPDKKFWIQVRSNQIMNTVTIQPIDKNLKLKTVTQNFKKLLLREQIKSTYLIDPGMVLLFKKKYLWQYILSWFSLCLCIYLLIIY